MRSIYNATSACNAATMIPTETQVTGASTSIGAWQLWGVLDGWFEERFDKTLSHSGEMIVKFSNHVAYCSSGAPNAPQTVTVTQILNGGGIDVITSIMTKNPGDGSYQFVLNGITYTSQGYYIKKGFPLNHTPHFYNNLQLQNMYGKTQVNSIEYSNPWSYPLFDRGAGHTAQAIQYAQADPWGKYQLFDRWTESGVDKGSNPTYPFTYTIIGKLLMAHYFQAVKTSFVQSGSGTIVVDGQSYTNPIDKYYRYHPTNPFTVTAVGNSQADYNLLTNHLFSHWTRSNDPGLIYTPSISFYASASQTWTAHFISKPLPPNDVSASGEVGDLVSLSWTAHPNATMFSKYKIYRRVKHNGVLGAESLISTITNRTTTQYSDGDYSVTSGYTHDLLYYDVRVEFTNALVSDPCYYAFTYGRMAAKTKGAKQTAEVISTVPQGFEIRVYPNPFNPSTKVRISLPVACEVRAVIYDMSGRAIKTVLNRRLGSGVSEMVWGGLDDNGEVVPSGTYFFLSEAIPIDGGEPVTLREKLLLLK